MAVVLDESPLSLITQRRGASPDVDHCRDWLAALLRAGHPVLTPAIAVYELRRELVRADKSVSLNRLDAFLAADPQRYLHLTRPVLDRASELWAWSRRQGKPTADPAALDGDVIIAAQALSLGLSPSGFVIATSNPKHLALFAPARRWQDIEPGIG
jgi:predicted nucleic acid-binding protein